MERASSNGKIVRKRKKRYVEENRDVETGKGRCSPRVTPPRRREEGRGGELRREGRRVVTVPWEGRTTSREQGVEGADRAKGRGTMGGERGEVNRGPALQST